MGIEYADSAQARQQDKAPQHGGESSTEESRLAFHAACESRRLAERVAFKARLAGALDQLEVFFGEPK